MATTKIVLRKKQNKDGTYPLAIRITKDRKSSFIHLGYNLMEKDWDATTGRVRKSYRNSARLNNFLLSKLSNAESKSLDLETNHPEGSSNSIKRSLKRKSKATFNEQAKEYLDNLTKRGRYNRLSAEEPRINRFKEFLGNQDISFPEITVALINRFKAYLKGTRSISDRTVANHLVVLRSIFNQAIKGQLVDAKYYPFGVNKIQIKFPDSIKIGLEPAEIARLEGLEIHDSRQRHARDIWLFSFYFAGMRVSDVFRLTWSDIQGDRLYYAMGKNNKAGSLKIPDKARNILRAYEGGKDDTNLVFPELKSFSDLSDTYHVQMRIKTKVNSINEQLKEVKKAAKISKPLTMHIPRHSFGNISGDRIPIQMLQKLYRHSSITTTIGYQANFIHKDADDALAAVIG